MGQLIVFLVVIWVLYEFVVNVAPYAWLLLLLVGLVVAIIPSKIPRWRKLTTEKQRRGFIIAGAVIAVFGVIMQIAATQEQNSAASSAAEVATLTTVAENEQKAAADQQQQAQDEIAAQQMGVSYSEYKAGENAQFSAHSACQHALIADATWSGARTDWIPKFSWSVQNDVITIEGNDVELANGFGGKREIDYVCQYDMSVQTAQIMSAD